VRGVKGTGARGHMTLGCMADNHAAKTYTRVGFQLVQECYTMQWTRTSTRCGENADVELLDGEANDDGLLLCAIAPEVAIRGGATNERLNHILPQWNRQPPSLRKMENLQCLAAVSSDMCGSDQFTVDKNIQAYIIYRDGAADVLATPGETSAEIMDICGSSSNAIEILLRSLQAQQWRLKLNSEGQHSDAMTSLRKCGFEPINHRLHLALDLSGKLTHKQLVASVVQRSCQAARL
jgi:hypothetical protein